MMAPDDDADEHGDAGGDESDGQGDAGLGMNDAAWRRLSRCLLGAHPSAGEGGRLEGGRRG